MTTGKNDIKIVFADGMFLTAPSMKNGHMHQILKFHVEYLGHVVTVFKALMTGKTRSLYDNVYKKLKELLPDTGLVCIVILHKLQMFTGLV